MDQRSTKTEAMTADTLAKRVFTITMIAAILYVGAIVVLMSNLQ
jgi:hypothetical protein